MIVITALAVTAGLRAQDPAPDGEDGAEREWIGGARFGWWTRCFGDLAGLRTQLEDSGVEVAGGLVADLAAPWSGDTSRKSALASLLDVNVAADLETLLGLPRTLAYVDAYSLAGRDPSRAVGDFQGISNIQGDNVHQIAELWVESWLSDSLRVKVGKVDFNSEFAFAESAGEFVNSTPGITPTIVAYPTFPDPATAVNVFYAPDEFFYVGAAVFDGAGGDGVRTGGRGPSTFFSSSRSDSYFLCAEVGVAWQGGGTWGSGRCALGGFHHTATFDRFDGGRSNGTEGLWLTCEQHVFRENPQLEGDEQGIAVFATIGVADDHLTACGTSVAVGGQWLGPVPGRDDDALAFGVFHCDLSDDAGAGTPEDETIFELLYRVQLTPAISLKPDLQYVVHPGGQSGVDDVLVAMLRFEVLF